MAKLFFLYSHGKHLTLLGLTFKSVKLITNAQMIKDKTFLKRFKMRILAETLKRVSFYSITHKLICQ